MKNVLNNGTKMVCFITQRPVHLGTEICCIQKSSGLADFSQRTFKQVSYRSAFKKIGDHTSLSALKMKKDRRSQLSLQTFFFFFLIIWTSWTSFCKTLEKNVLTLQWLLIFKRKTESLENHVAKEILLFGLESEEGCQQVSRLLKYRWRRTTWEKLNCIFPFLSMKKYAWLKDSSFSGSSAHLWTSKLPTWVRLKK